MMALKSDADGNVLERQVKHELGVRNTEETQQKEIKKVWNQKAKSAMCWFVFFSYLYFTSDLSDVERSFFFPLSAVDSILKTINNFGTAVTSF